MLVFEVMSRGAQPYSEFASLSEVAERIKNGYTMSCPEGCRPELHAEVMLPCWRPQESKRPGFAALCHTLESLGATLLEVERARRPSARQATTAVYHANEHTPDSSWQADIRDYTMRGVPHQLGVLPRGDCCRPTSVEIEGKDTPCA